MLATVDIVILIVVLLSALIGLMRGLVKEIASLVIWLSAFVLALAFAAPAASALVRFELDPSVRVVIGFVAVFAGVLIVGAVLQWLLARLVESTGLTGTDRFLGFLFGGGRGAIVVIVVLIATRPFLEQEAWWTRSAFIPELLRFEQDIVELLRLAGRSLSDLEQVGE